MKTPTFIVIHHSAVSHEKNADQFEANNRFHEANNFPLGTLGFHLGYNYEIAANGVVRKARQDGEKTAAVTQSWTRARSGIMKFIPRYTGWMNDGRALHICLDGSFDSEKPTPPQIYALRDWLRAKCMAYKIPKGNIYFHSDFAPKTCPGNSLNLEWIRNLVV